MVKHTDEICNLFQNHSCVINLCILPKNFKANIYKEIIVNGINNSNLERTNAPLIPRKGKISALSKYKTAFTVEDL